MVAATFNTILPFLFADEGGYCNDKNDPGGPTKYGITIHDVRKYINPNATASNVKALTKDDAKLIFRERYWNALNCDKLPAGLDYTVFDYGVHSGVPRAGRVLRRLCGMSTDRTDINDSVIARVRQRNVNELIEAMNDERERFLRGLPRAKYFPGWFPRVVRVRARSLRIAAGVVAEVVPVGHIAPVTPGGRGVATASGGKTAAKGFVGSALSVLAVWHAWVIAHPYETAAFVLFTVTAAALLVYRDSRAAAKKQATISADVEPVDINVNI